MTIHYYSGVEGPTITIDQAIDIHAAIDCIHSLVLEREAQEGVSEPEKEACLEIANLLSEALDNVFLVLDKYGFEVPDL